MNVLWKLGGFAAASAAIFGAACGAGGAVPAISNTANEHAQHGADTRPRQGGEPDGHADHGKPAASTPPGGLHVAEGGYSLDLRTRTLTAARGGDLSFVIRDLKGRPVTAYERAHGKELHLIVASRDLRTYRHLHPGRSADGTWSTPVDLPAAGGYRVFADFKPAHRGQGVTLGADLAVAGTYRPAGLPGPSSTATVDGYQVTLGGDLRAGVAGRLTLTVSRDGRKITDLEPYLGAYGHLVALRSGDLAYLHVHPNGEPEDGATEPGPDVSFTTTAPSAGTYRLFFDFRHQGTVRTAAFTVRVGLSGEEQPPASGEAAERHESDAHRH
ncbi:hypothetical protein ACH3VS_39435 [Streptomyces sp. WSLK1-3]|uniref:hypothetical protein n=1 Tax=Streptomyces sp. WSLK1-3 TaxID=3375475 RepID=UPI0037A6FB9E